MSSSVLSNPALATAATTRRPINACGPLKRTRIADIVTPNKRLCVADFDSESSDDDAAACKMSKLSRPVSLSAVATATQMSPPSPPASSSGDMPHGYLGGFSSDLDNARCHGNQSHVTRFQERRSSSHSNKSINVASLCRRRTVTNPETISRKRRQPYAPRSDLTARAKCFDYLVSAIDEAWAQYCTYTSTAEDEIYNSEENNKHKSVVAYYDIPTSPISLYEEEDAAYSSDGESYSPRTPYNYSYGSSVPRASMCMYNRKPSILDVKTSSHYNTSQNYDDEYSDEDEEDDETANNSTVSDKNLAPSEQPGSVRLLNLKTRLMNVKYFLQDLVDADEVDSSRSFWNRWDLIKYSAIELVEDDGDDDEVVDATIKRLEHGRYYAMNY